MNIQTPSNSQNISLLEKNLNKGSFYKSEKILRCEQFRQQTRDLRPFTQNTNKEILMMKNVKEYERYFSQTYDERPLFLYPMNEAGVEKFVCSYIRPTKTGYVELFDYIQCAEYISNFVVFEELDVENTLPKTLVSPFNVIRWQAADAAELAVLYASLLIGVGYDAFVVIGTSSIDLARKNESNVPCTFLSSKDYKCDTEAGRQDLNANSEAMARASGKKSSALNPYKKPFREITNDQGRNVFDSDPNSKDPRNRKNPKTKNTLHNIPGKFTTHNLGNGTTLGNLQSNCPKSFFKFDVIKQDDETPIEGQLFGDYGSGPTEEDNPYYIPVGKILNADKVIEQKNMEDLFYKNENKYVYKTNLEDQFNGFLADDEPLSIMTSSKAKQNILLHSQKTDKRAEGNKENSRASDKEIEESDDRKLHFWVLVRSSELRDLPDTVFVDPPSGRHWSIDDSSIPFHSVSQIFNNKNAWINLNQNLAIHNIDFEAFDDYENEDFEFVLDEKGAQTSGSDNDVDLSDAQNMNQFSPDQSQVDKNSFVHFKSTNPLSVLNAQTNTFSQNTNMMTSTNPNNVVSNINQIKVSKLVTQSLAERMAGNEELFQRPSSWVPKLEIEKEPYICRYAGCRQRKFYKKCQADFFSQGSQPDGLVKRVQLYFDLKRQYLFEIRSYYKDRIDRMYMKKEFPFEFRSVESFSMIEGTTAPNSSTAVPHWREIEHFMGRKIIFRFYPHRFFDGLIEREEIIGEKTIERYENRDDRLIYMSVRFENTSCDIGNKELYCYRDRHVEDVKIVKMVQKFDVNSFLPASSQISKVVFDISRNTIRVIYHMEPHQITPAVYEISRTAFSKIMSHSDKNKAPLRSDQQQIQQLYSLEKDCFSKIKKSEDSVNRDIKSFKAENDEMGTLTILKANKLSVKKYADHSETGLRVGDDANKENMDEADAGEETGDQVSKVIRKRGLMGQKIDAKTAEEIKFEILSSLQERFIQRAEIIDHRFKEEKNKMKTMQKKFQKKATENGSFADEKDFEEELYQYNLKLGILETRLFNFQKIAFEKYEDMQKKLAADPRLMS